MHLYGRSSSHFTRIPRIFAAELDIVWPEVLHRPVAANAQAPVPVTAGSGADGRTGRSRAD